MQFAKLLAFVSVVAAVAVERAPSILPNTNEIPSDFAGVANTTSSENKSAAATVISYQWTGINSGGTQWFTPLNANGAGCINFVDGLNNHMRSIETFSPYYCDYWVGQGCTGSKAGITGYSYLSNLQTYDGGRFAVLYDAASSYSCTTGSTQINRNTAIST
ncbi:hypothetical protein DL96DRAFT_1712539 [Flagelloscypha sp. PMI_526]|nr:hypothetical protein DL96DRAFT_1712539 [Flagelloscypha sp. PMI_526]